MPDENEDIYEDIHSGPVGRGEATAAGRPGRARIDYLLDGLRLAVFSLVLSVGLTVASPSARRHRAGSSA